MVIKSRSYFKKVKKTVMMSSNICPSNLVSF